jgi:hypothetical protein
MGVRWKDKFMPLAATMKAAVLHAPGGPDTLNIEDRPVPLAHAGEVLIRVKAFGLNRSELFSARVFRPEFFYRASSASRRSARWWPRPAASSRKGRRSPL